MPRDPYRRRSEHMTPADIVAKLFTDKGVNAERIEKAQGLAKRQRIEWSSVLNAMSDEQRALVEASNY